MNVMQSKVFHVRRKVENLILIKLEFFSDPLPPSWQTKPGLHDPQAVGQVTEFPTSLRCFDASADTAAAKGAF